ncbi:MAG: cation:proton antiporter [Solirubrobacteraceae bacterium]
MWLEIVKLGIFVVFGSLLTIHGLFGSGWAAVGVVLVALLVARPVAVFAALTRTKTDLATRAFMSWFGPKGVATMTFSLLVLSDQIAAGPTIFGLAALTLFCSILAHGVTDTAGAEWLAKRTERAELAQSAERSRARRRALRLSGSVAVAVGVAAVRRIHDPADEDGEENEGDKTADQGPVHDRKHIGRARTPTRSRRRPGPGRPSGVQSDLLAGRRERPRHLHLSLLAKDEAHLTGRSQAVGVNGPEGRAGLIRGDRAQLLLMKETVLTARLRRGSATVRHT